MAEDVSDQEASRICTHVPAPLAARLVPTAEVNEVIFGQAVASVKQVKTETTAIVGQVGLYR